MADNTRGGSESGTAPLVASDEVTYSGDISDVQLLRPVHVTGAEGSKTVVDLTNASGVYVHGGVAHDVADSGNAIKTGGKAVTGIPAAVASGDRVDAWYALNGQQAVMLVNNVGGIANITDSPHIDGLSNANATLLSVVWPSLYNGTSWDRVRNLPAFDTAVAAPVRMGMQAVALPDQRFTSVALGTVIGNTQAWDVNSANSALVHTATTQTGTFLFEVSADGTNYINAEVFDVSADVWVSGTNIVPTANKVYRIPTIGWRTLRARTIATLNGTVAMTATLAATSNLISAIDVGPAPHNIGYTITGKTAQYATAQTGVALWTPAAGKRLVITSYQIQAGGTVGGTIQLWFGASGDTTYTRGADLAIFDGEVLPSATLKPGVVQTGVWPASTADHILRVTNTGTINPLTFTVWGYEA